MSMHIDAKPGEISEVVIVVGDPDRATYISARFLAGAVCVNERRGALCYTGKYNGRRISVMATGMGIPSMMIYATELYRDYGCEAIIRVGTSAGYRKDMRRHDIVLSQAACHTSGINDHLFEGTYCPIADFGLLQDAYAAAKKREARFFVGNTICNDRIYRSPQMYQAKTWAEYGILCSEMEGAGLYTAAAQFGRKALMMVSILSGVTIDDAGKEHIAPLPEEENQTMDTAILVALDTATAFAEENGYGCV